MKLRKLILLLSLSIIGVHSDDCTSKEKIIEYLVNASPSDSDEIHIEGDYKIREWNYIHLDNSLRTDGIFEISWVNKHLDFSTLNPCQKSVTIKNNLKFWRPQLHLSYSTDGQIHDHNLVVHENGTVIFSKKIRQTIPCHSETDNYPFSNTTCTFEWKYVDVTGYPKIGSSNVTSSVKQRFSGNLMLNRVDFVLSNDEDPSLVYSFSQNPQDALMNFFVPTLLFLIPPWLTLLLGPMAITRCCILMTSLILLSIHYHTNAAIFIGSGGVNAISLWKLFTYAYVIAIVIELIVITLLASVGRSKTCCFGRRRSAKYEMEPLYEEMNDLRQRKTRKTRPCCRRMALFVDVASFIFFGAILAVFIFGYYIRRQTVVRFINEFEMESLNIFKI
ncbi:CBN-LGC-32 protein [Caenorhabditis brenneri]|uniref:CBN-LGC-32 protein n=1 Tax=Caenorhabditis brenneri TaxID=135651 RepID=G0NHM9_CAEBE|nr:CBN-LGC-32 protein [Caenorhabditis brenneri]